jgi:hypothetical protein
VSDRPKVLGIVKDVTEPDLPALSGRRARPATSVSSSGRRVEARRLRRQDREPDLDDRRPRAARGQPLGALQRAARPEARLLPAVYALVRAAADLPELRGSEPAAEAEAQAALPAQTARRC